VPAAGFKLRGQPKVYVKTAASGNRRAQAFCPDCGSRLWASAEHDPQVYNLRLGGVRQRAQLAPKVAVWCNPRCLVDEPRRRQATFPRTPVKVSIVCRRSTRNACLPVRLP
jgi:hypothetical protein